MPTHRVGEDGWELSIKALIDNADCSHKARFTLIDADGNEKASAIADLRPIISAKLPVEDPVLWNGRKNPYLYTVRCEIFDSSIGEVTDNIDIRTGLRDYRIDSHKGFFLNGREIFRKDGRLTLADGTLAGADIDMASCIRYMRDVVGIDLEEALRMASLYPAEAIGMTGRKGRLTHGHDADFTAIDAGVNVAATWIAGTPVFAA